MVSLREPKTAVRMANAESVLIKDVALVKMLRRRMMAGGRGDLLYPFCCGDLSTAITGYADLFGVVHPHATPHSLRRGGGEGGDLAFQAMPKHRRSSSVGKMVPDTHC